MAICPYCGSQIGDHAEICGFCGGKLTLGFVAPPEEITREIPEVDTESEYEGIPEDILGSVLGSLGARSVPTERSPEVPAADFPDIPTIEEILDIPEPAEIPAVEEAPAVPEPAQIPEIPVIEEAPAVPEPEELPEIPAVEEVPAWIAEKDVPVPPAEQPAYAQPVYAQPAEPKKKNNWLLPAVIIAALALVCILFFATRGGSGSGAKTDDPNLGVYKASVVEMYGMQLEADQIYTQGFTIELKPNGVCEINSDGDKGKGKWTLEDDKLTIDDGHNVITGTLSDGVLSLENMLDMGLNMTMEKQE